MDIQDIFGAQGFTGENVDKPQTGGFVRLPDGVKQVATITGAKVVERDKNITAQLEYSVQYQGVTCKAWSSHWLKHTTEKAQAYGQSELLEIKIATIKDKPLKSITRLIGEKIIITPETIQVNGKSFTKAIAWSKIDETTKGEIEEKQEKQDEEEIPF